MRELFEAGQARNAHDYIYVVAGEFTANAREFSDSQSDLTHDLICGVPS